MKCSPYEYDKFSQFGSNLNVCLNRCRNEQQLNTLKRMGIETVGQLASANTMIGKSIPVGDNRIQRLRNALKAYDNDRKLKGKCKLFDSNRPRIFDSYYL